MAHIHKRGDKWAYSVHNPNHTVTGGPRKLTKSGYRTNKEAQLVANKLEETISEGGVIQEANITFEDYANEWVDYYATQVKVSGVRARKIAMKHLVSIWGALPLKKIIKYMYQSRIDTLSQGYSHNYIDSIHTTGNMIFKYAIRQDLLRSNPTDGFVMPKKQVTVEDIEGLKIQDKFLELKELKSFISVIKEHGLYLDYLAFVTLAYTGMRSGELLALKWSDIDFQKKTLRITKTYYNPNNNNNNNNNTDYKLGSPKTKNSIRIIMIDDKLAALL
jgi:integrase